MQANPGHYTIQFSIYMGSFKMATPDLERGTPKALACEAAMWAGLLNQVVANKFKLIKNAAGIFCLQYEAHANLLTIEKSMSQYETDKKCKAWLQSLDVPVPQSLDLLLGGGTSTDLQEDGSKCYRTQLIGDLTQFGNVNHFSEPASEDFIRTLHTEVNKVLTVELNEALYQIERVEPIRYTSYAFFPLQRKVAHQSDCCVIL